MSYWFKPKRYGFGAAPASWQGWALVIAYVAALVTVTTALADTKPFAAAVIAAVLTLAFVVVSLWKTEGGWRWRWGGD